MKILFILLLILGTVKGQSFDQRLIRIPYAFDIDTIVNHEEVNNLLETYGVDKIVYHYSYYRLNPEFDQIKLNQDRKQHLLKSYPVLKSNIISWKDSVNYDCKNPEECKQVFHGYSIYLQNGSNLTKKDELSFVDSMMNYLRKVNTKRLKKKEKPKYMKSVWDDRVGWVPDTSSSFTIETKESIQSKIPNLINNTISRNNWENSIYVIDITASMSKYYCDFLKVINNNFIDSIPMRIGYFNDGNGKENKNKVIGSTGGIYFYEGFDLEKMNKTIKQHLFVSSKDSQENDAEGIIEAQEKFKDFDHIILICDNYSPVRDFNLYRNINKPVHIILCGANDGNINSQYIALAFITGGSIHNIKRDIDISPSMSPGETFRAGNIEYQFNGIGPQAFPLFDRKN
ncbi:hypothetical protein N9V83_02995 [Flavobacteriales bacterium]|jgi:hypothetical protein|nr:hypothetical protein [Flavobacteriales bacterium]